ncbi:CatB-related O-acetyltransferase [Vibrio chagasii]|uniref:CatB-related O-acetyltransferase n=1 Tax=Vibrio chagasii TaxID=170679 RepID=A0A7V7NXV8_9VIBR|nr:CatB-related O-acetyltransferase [Vibrio chagasii]KAB0482977.1 CatB-related O-acetyltransferase [Vibrio chagasii]
MSKKLLTPAFKLQLMKLNIQVAKNTTLFSRFSYNKSIRIEENTGFFFGKKLWAMGRYSYSMSSLPRDTIVGRYCSISFNVAVMGDNHPIDRFTTSTVTYSNEQFNLPSPPIDLVDFEQDKQPIVIGHDVWIGANVVLKRGITIGNGAIIASNAVITKDVPCYTIVGGVPGKVIRKRFSDSQITQLESLCWWDLDLEGIGKLVKSNCNIEDFIERITIGKETGELKPSPLNFIEL